MIWNNFNNNSLNLSYSSKSAQLIQLVKLEDSTELSARESLVRQKKT